MVDVASADIDPDDSACVVSCQDAWRGGQPEYSLDHENRSLPSGPEMTLFLRRTSAGMVTAQNGIPADTIGTAPIQQRLILRHGDGVLGGLVDLDPGWTTPTWDALDEQATNASSAVSISRGAMNVALLGEQLDEFVRRRALWRFESTSADRTIHDADPQLLEELADVLNLPADPTDTLGKPYIEVFHDREDGSESSRRRIAGPLQHQVIRPTAKVAEAVGHDVVALGVRRYEHERLPTEVLREAIDDAVAHRVYEDHRRAVRIDIRGTSVATNSPGPRPEPVTLANLREPKAACNVRAIEALPRLKLAENAGRGAVLDLANAATHQSDPSTGTTLATTGSARCVER